MTLASRVAARFLRAGGADFQVYVPIPDLSRAFREAVQDARHESGHGGYSGTIAEKSDVKARRTVPMTRAEAFEFAQKDAGNNDKFGPAFAVPVGEASKAKEKKDKIKVPGRDQWAASEEAKKLLTEKYAEPGLVLKVDVEKASLVKAGKLPEITITKGGPEGFQLKSPNYSGPMLRDTLYGSRAEAVAAFKDFVLRNKPNSGYQFSIAKVKTTDSFTIGDTSKSMQLFEVEAKITFEKPTGKILGWLFYGIASS